MPTVPFHLEQTFVKKKTKSDVTEVSQACCLQGTELLQDICVAGSAFHWFIFYCWAFAKNVHTIMAKRASEVWDGWLFSNQKVWLRFQEKTKVLWTNLQVTAWSCGKMLEVAVSVGHHSVWIRIFSPFNAPNKTPTLKKLCSCTLIDVLIFVWVSQQV